jgi:hypothetical protein
MRALAQVSVVIALVGFVAAITLVTVVAAFDAAITVHFTTFGSDEGIYASDETLCDGFQSVACN